jgi:multidrug efflux system membrane fusion protein
MLMPGLVLRRMRLGLRRWPAASGLAIATALVSAACGHSNAAAPPASANAGRGAGSGRSGSGTAAVTVAQVVEKSMPRVIRAVGNVEASSSVDIHAQVTGQLTEVGFAEGSDVKEGQLLFALDPRPFQAALDQAQAQLEKDRAQSANAKATADRNADLYQRGLLDKADYETSTASATSLAATVTGDLAQVETAKLQLQFARITAPVSGRTGSLQVHPGALIRANDTTPMVTINQIAPVNVSFTVPSHQLQDIKDQQAHGRLRVDARVAGSTAAPSEGQVAFIDNVVDPTTDTIRLKATFPNTDGRLWPGQFVEVSLELSVDPHAIVVPAVAVQPGQQGTYVFVVNANHTVDTRAVTVTRTEGDLAIIATGLAAGETVVTDGQLGLAPGMTISVKPTGGRGAS